jgi:hypothetical protein
VRRQVFELIERGMQVRAMRITLQFQCVSHGGPVEIVVGHGSTMPLDIRYCQTLCGFGKLMERNSWPTNISV